VQPWLGRAAALVFGAALLGSCKGGATEVSTFTITPPPPLTMAEDAILRLEDPDPVGSPRQAKEIEELITIQGQRTLEQAAEASSWQESPVVRWNEIARGMVAKYNTSPPVASRLYALLSVAQHDALVSAVHNQRIHKRPPPSSADPRVIPLFAAKVDSTYPSDHAAVAAASMAVLAFVYQSKAEVEALTKKAAAHEESRLWAGVSYRSDIVAGDRIGREVAARIITHAMTDGAKPVLPWPGKVPTGQGMWFSSELPAVAPLRPAWGAVRPWLMTSGNQFRPEPPPDLDSPAFKRDLAEVVQLSRTRTSEQLQSAYFWADGPSTPTPPGHWNQIAADLIRQKPGSQLSAARVLAFLNMAIMDAGISCWDTKYAYWLIRPSQVDPTITTPIGLPNFPSYPSGHSTFSGAAAVVLGHFFPGERDHLEEMAREASMSRVYGGIHYRFDGETGLAMGRAVGKLAIEKEQKEHRE
jgi:membrane-associated phospholipid phosphatase